VFIAGRGARGARADLERAAEECGALLATSAAAKGLFRGNPWDLDVSGGFASPLAAELIAGADVIVGWGCSLNMWTTRHGKLIGRSATVVQVDDDPAAIGADLPVRFGVVGDVAQAASAVADLLATERKLQGQGGEPPAVQDKDGYRSAELRERIAREVRWRDVAYADESDGQRIDPRALSIALDDLLPAQRTVVVDSGNFMGYPSMYLSVPDEAGFCFTQAFQSIGLGLASAIGAAVARPDRLTVAALGDGGALMGINELETAVRLGVPMVIVVYDDEAYGAEVHHFGPDGDPLDTVRFPAADIAAIGRGFGCEGVTVRSAADLAAVRGWLDGPRDRPLLVDAKVTSAHGSWWLEEAFRGHLPLPYANSYRTHRQHSPPSRAAGRDAVARCRRTERRRAHCRHRSCGRGHDPANGGDRFPGRHRRRAVQAELCHVSHRRARRAVARRRGDPVRRRAHQAAAGADHGAVRVPGSRGRLPARRAAPREFAGQAGGHRAFGAQLALPGRRTARLLAEGVPR
jgi:hypothetical protein